MNWCPNDQTVLANEQVVQGRCERCGAAVTKRELTQWYFKITDYAAAPAGRHGPAVRQVARGVLTMQRNWIGRSEGAFADFVVEGREEPIKVFTTRPDTLFGATFMVVAPDSKLADEICTPDQRPAFDAYLTAVKASTEIERLSTEREKTGVFLGAYATNPVNGELIPVWAADYVLADYGTGAIMAVPGQDQRDWDFAEKFGLPIVRTVQPEEGFDGKAYTGDGPAINSANDEISLNGLAVDEAKAVIIDWLEANGRGERTINYRLRDWLLSRQRFWGAPIPIIHCPNCGEVAVPDDQLPVELPDLRGQDLVPKGVSPLAAARGLGRGRLPEVRWRRQARHRHDGHLRRLVLVLPALLLAGVHRGPVRPRRGPEVDAGSVSTSAAVEHAILHLLYSRFFTKALHDMGMLDFVEPFERLLNQGQVINEGKAMSKSLGNGVNLGEQIDAFGVDAIRLTMVFAGPPDDDIDWADMSPGGSLRFLQRAWRLSGVVEAPVGSTRRRGDLALRKVTHRTVHEASRADRVAALQRDGRPDHGAGERHPQGDRLRPRCRPTRRFARRSRPSRSC